MSLERAVCKVHVCISKIAQQHPWVPFRWQLTQVFSVAEDAALPESSDAHAWSEYEVALFED